MTQWARWRLQPITVAWSSSKPPQRPGVHHVARGYVSRGLVAELPQGVSQGLSQGLSQLSQATTPGTSKSRIRGVCWTLELDPVQLMLSGIFTCV